MNYHAKRKLTRSSMYIVLALTICTVMALTVVAFVGAQRQKPSGNPPVPDTSIPSVKPDSNHSSNNTVTPPTNQNQNEGTNSTEKPSGTEKPDDSQTNTTPDGSDSSDGPDLPTGSEGSPEYVLPADGYVLKSFSIDLPVWSMTMEDYRAHTGIDISTACGSAVYAMSEGVIADITEDPLMGVSMTVIHYDGNSSLYQNLAKELPQGIEVGTVVSPGQIIASVGDTSLIEQCDTDHLHLEIFTSTGERINPESLLDFSDVPTTDNGVE